VFLIFFSSAIVAFVPSRARCFPLPSGSNSAAHCLRRCFRCLWPESITLRFLPFTLRGISTTTPFPSPSTCASPTRPIFTSRPFPPMPLDFPRHQLTIATACSHPTFKPRSVGDKAERAQDWVWPLCAKSSSSATVVSAWSRNTGREVCSGSNCRTLYPRPNRVQGKPVSRPP